MVQVQRTVEAPADFGTDVIAVPAGAAMKIELRLESVVEGVLVTGSVHATATGACVRCLDPTVHEVDGHATCSRSAARRIVPAPATSSRSVTRRAPGCPRRRRRR